VNEQTTATPPRRRRGLLATLLALVALAVAVPASGALAGGNDDTTGGAPAGEQRTAPVQDRGGGRDGDCPEKDGRGGDGGQSSGASTGNPV
jgi:nitrous oxide reductase